MPGVGAMVRQTLAIRRDLSIAEMLPGRLQRSLAPSLPYRSLIRNGPETPSHRQPLPTLSLVFPQLRFVASDRLDRVACAYDSQ